MRLTASNIITLGMLSTWQSAVYVYTTRKLNPASARYLLERLAKAGYLECRPTADPRKGRQGWDYRVTQKGREAKAGTLIPDEPPVAPRARSNNPWEQLRYPHLEKGGVQ